ncbi:unannotated protein [freshwater metagenome]|uniref:Unannotated protein n=1 Tax=freshwater metagenome TaxID=449393 RepID=A0A6J6A1W2_9ZZZZ|nr:hypothetical protein [Actinomycetota bacterium]
MNDEPTPQQGWVADEIAAEFPELRIAWLLSDCRGTRSDPGVAERLASLASRFSGRQAVELRQQQVPAAYRSFFRQLGIDPEQHPTPIERAVVGRLLAGGNPPQDRVSDALLLALLETSVEVVAFDAALATPPVGIRSSLSDDRPGGRELAPGTLMIVDSRQSLAPLFALGEGPPAATAAGERVLLVGVAVPGVSALAVDEALTIAAAALGGG